MAIGENMKSYSQARIAAEIAECWGLPLRWSAGRRPNHRDNADDAGTATPRVPRLFVKVSDTAPGADAADAPSGLGDLCLHVTTAGVRNVYVRAADASWVKVTANT